MAGLMAALARGIEQAGLYTIVRISRMGEMVLRRGYCIFRPGAWILDWRSHLCKCWNPAASIAIYLEFDDKGHQLSRTYITRIYWLSIPASIWSPIMNKQPASHSSEL
jgi:hypothetical protein